MVLSVELSIYDLINHLWYYGIILKSKMDPLMMELSITFTHLWYYSFILLSIIIE